MQPHSLLLSCLWQSGLFYMLTFHLPILCSPLSRCANSGHLFPSLLRWIWGALRGPPEMGLGKDIRFFFDTRIEYL